MSRLTLGIPQKIRDAAALGCLALAAYFGFTYSGPFRWLAELEMRLMGRYYTFLTGMLVLLGLMLMLLLPLQLARKLGVLGDPAASPEEHAQYIQAHTERWKKRQPAITVLMLGAALSFVGVRDWLRAQQGAQLEQVSIAALESGKRPASTWVEVADASPAWNATLEWEVGHTKNSFVPVVSTNWRDGQPIALVLKLSSSTRVDKEVGVSAFRGASDAEGLPGAIDGAFRDAQLNTANALVLEVGNKPTDRQTLAHFALGGGILALLVGCGLAWVQLRRERRVAWSANA